MYIYRVETEHVKSPELTFSKYFSSMQKALDYAELYRVEFQVLCLRENKIYALQSDKEACIKAEVVLRPTFIEVVKVDAI